MTLALLTVDDKEILSVLALIRELKREAARLFFLVWIVAVDSESSSALSGSGGLRIPPAGWGCVTAVLMEGFGLCVEALVESSSFLLSRLSSL